MGFLGIGGSEAVLLIFLFILLFGAAKIPELARSIGRAKREFQAGVNEEPAPVAAAPQSEDESIRKAARDLGISVDGKTTPELKAEIQRRLA